MAGSRGGRRGPPVAALEPDDVVLGGGNVKKLKELPEPTFNHDSSTNNLIRRYRKLKEAL